MFILLLVLLPSPASAASTASATADDLNCRDACEHCDDAAEDPPLREVYCSMCDECVQQAHKKQNKPDTLQIREKQDKPDTLQIREKQDKPDALQTREKQDDPDLRMQEYGWYPYEQMEGYYPECPTAPPCSEEEELKEEVVTEPPYMPPCLPPCPTRPRPTCPPIIPCKPKKLKLTKKPTTKQPCRPPCPNMPWCYPYHGQNAEKLKDTHPDTTKDFVYLYVGIPKGVMTQTDPS